MFKAIFVLIVQAAATFVAFLAASAVYLLWRHGFDYMHTTGFSGEMNTASKISLVITGILFVVIVCYRAFKKDFEIHDNHANDT